MKDRWGIYYALTGHESPKACFWCGNPTKQRYCSKICRHLYWGNFNWKRARELCLKRANNKCEKCGQEPKAWMDGMWGVKADGISSDDGIGGDITQKDTMLEVHHIIPTLGKKRDWSRKNVPENLLCLCQKCHRAINKGE